MCNHHTPSNNKKLRHGAALEHGKAHQNDHKQWSRRGFLKGLGIAGGTSLVLGNTPVTALGASPFNFMLNAGVEDRILVIIRLNGGNDGLNTFVPLYDYGTYQANRPGIALPQNSLVDLSPEFGMHGAMGDLENLWLDSKMKVVNSVGYPNHNLSHFRSTDILNSTSDANVVDASGWMGRFLENEFPDFITDPPAKPPAIQIGAAGSILFNGSDSNRTNYAVSLANPDQLYEIAQNGQLYSTENLPDCYYGDQLEYLRIVTNNTFRYAEVIKEAFDAGSNQANYGNFGNNSLAQQLALVARLIKGGLGTKLYMVNLGSFDTHADQLNEHQFLLNDLGNSVKNFYDDLGADYGKEVLSMTYSEFGRRVQQNASQGTNHGAAAPMMLFGEGVNGNGFLGDNPNLTNLDINDNLQFGTDFREVYASVLENWLCIDGSLVDNVLGQSFNRIDLGLTCNPSTSSPTLPGYALQHEARYSSDGKIYITYTLPSTMFTKVEVFNMLGQPVATLHKGRQSGGEHQLAFTGASRFAPSNYVYRIEANGQAYSDKIVLTR